MSDIIDASRPLGSFSEDASSCRDVSTIPAAYQGLAVYHLEDDEGFCLPLDQDGRIVFSSQVRPSSLDPRVGAHRDAQGTARAVSEGFLNTNRDGCIDVSRIDLETPANGPFWHQGPSCYSLDNVDNTITARRSLACSSSSLTLTQYYNHYGHDPSLPAGIIFTALFGLAMLAHVLLVRAQITRTRHRLTLYRRSCRVASGSSLPPLVVSVRSRPPTNTTPCISHLPTAELIGWIGRTLSATDNTASAASDNYFLIQTVCLIIGCAHYPFLSASSH